MSTAVLAQLQALAPACRPRIAIVLGSGWSGMTAHLQGVQRISYRDLPGFPRAAVPGHAGELWLGRLGPHDVAVLSGRQHAYETGAVDSMAIALRTLRAWGCAILVQTNAAGSLRPGMPAGSLMLLQDHLNLPQRSPLVGEAGAERFVSMVNAYDELLRTQALAAAARRGVALHQGVYAWMLGPQFETPAEIRMLQALGADAVGMSTVPETLIARHAGMRVLALSLITNMGAGLSGETLSHAHTLAQAQAASAVASDVLIEVVQSLVV